MANNVLAPNGLSHARARTGMAASYANSQYTIKRGYATAIGRGDMVKTLTGGNQGYIGLAVAGDPQGLGVFVGCDVYYDSTAQMVMHGLNGSWPTNANPNADVPCFVIDDPNVTFIAQLNASTWTQSMRGRNIGFANNGAPNGSGQSTLSLDFATLGDAATLPLRIMGVAGVTGGPRDPANTYPWLEVMLNPAWCERNIGAGI